MENDWDEETRALLMKSSLFCFNIAEKNLKISFFQLFCLHFSARVLVTFSHFPSTCCVVCVCVCVYVCFPNKSVKVVTQFLRPGFWGFLCVCVCVCVKDVSEPHVTEVGGVDTWQFPCGWHKHTHGEKHTQVHVGLHACTHIHTLNIERWWTKY